MFYFGVDLGQKRDHTAFALLERWDRANAYGGRALGVLEARHLERVPLGTPYTMVVEKIRRMTEHASVAGGVALVVDATGVGLPVVDLLRQARLRCELTAVSITGGEKENQAGGIYYVPRRDLISGVRVMLEKGELKIAKELRETGALVKELVELGKAPHDDLVLSVALACWRARRKGIGFGHGRLPIG